MKKAKGAEPKLTCWASPSVCFLKPLGFVVCALRTITSSKLAETGPNSSFVVSASTCSWWINSHGLWVVSVSTDGLSFFPSFCQETPDCHLFRSDNVHLMTFIPYDSSRFRLHAYIWPRLVCLIFMKGFVPTYLWGQT